MSWLQVYDLRQDLKEISNVQEATLTTEHYGIEPTHGLFGSEQWWQHVENSTLPLHTMRGEITRVYMAGMNDWPEFEFRCADDSLHRFPRYVTPVGHLLDEEYVVGRHVELDYVWQECRRKAPNWGMARETMVVTAIRIAT
ncbi:hypothetical protein [Erythrobacter ani]|uniref:Uncharacterized protein n=1 Tax=Erythrobacter ani TaxID=2827235 RepID=A0ABS6SPZ1_9SPHN|nr:hypothetical protein [Erythrobacter ani]MBV7267087.1 hypothetical protein [Erythrobacter ani]